MNKEMSNLRPQPLSDGPFRPPNLTTKETITLTSEEERKAAVQAIPALFPPTTKTQ